MKTKTYICSRCGKEHDDLVTVHLAGGETTEEMCAECAAELGYMLCADCGEWYPEDETRSDGCITVCETCYESDWLTCEDCGALIRSNDAYYATDRFGYETYVCEDCCDRDYVRCEHCGELFHESRVESDGNIYLCDDCRDMYYLCDDCGLYVHEDEVVWVDGDPYCENCAEEHESREPIHDYHYKPEPIFQYRSSEEKSVRKNDVLLFGVELEVDHGDGTVALATELVGLEQPLYIKRDGSLDSGLEIVTHPGTLAFHQYEMRWAEISRICRSHGFKSHDTTTCGLHIHIGKKQMGETCLERESVAGKIVLLVNAVWDDIVRFSRRNPSRLERWANRPCLRGDLLAMSDADLVLAGMETTRGGRYQAVNLCNSATVELRFFRGTLKRDTIIASLQLANNLTKYAMTHDAVDCVKATFADVLSVERFQELDAYWAERSGASNPT
jgi:hypothetical protein